MNRFNLALALLLCVFTMLLGASAAEAASAVPAQADWATAKKAVTLPNGVRMAYVELGDPKGEPLLLLHGYTDSSRSWSLVAPHLVRYRLLIPDQRGHGASSAPECCYALSDFAYDARLFLDALGVRRAGVAGHSMGSMVAIELAARYPDRVSGIALLGSTGLTAARRGTWLFDNASALRAPLDPQSAFMREWHPANQPTPVDRAFADAAMRDLLRTPLHVWHGVMHELEGVPIARHAPDVKAPVLILSGGADPLFPPEHHAALVAAFPAARSHVYAGLGHNFLWEQPADVGRRLSEFFGR